MPPLISLRFIEKVPQPVLDKVSDGTPSPMSGSSTVMLVLLVPPNVTSNTSPRAASTVQSSRIAAPPASMCASRPGVG